MSNATYPELVYSYPDSNQKDVAVTSPITLDWSNDLDVTQFSSPSSLAQRFILFREDTNDVVSLAYTSYNPSTRRVTLTPSSTLLGNCKYRLVVKTGLKDSLGRKTVYDFVVPFTTASVGLSTVTLTNPPDSSVLTSAPYHFIWSPTVVTTGVVGLGYDVSFYEHGNLVGAFTTTNSYLDLIPGSYEGVLGNLTGRTFEWCVTARTNVGVTGTVYYANPSSKFTISFGSATADRVSTDATSSRTYAFDEFTVPKTLYVESIDPENLTTQQVVFPPIAVHFSTPIATGNYSSYFSVVRKDQIPRNDTPNSYLEFPVSGTWSFSGVVATFTPNDVLYKNARYTIKVAKGLPSYDNSQTLTQTYTSQFSTLFDPYYVDIRVIKSRIRSEANTLPDDLINFYIHSASLEAKAKYQAWLYGIPTTAQWGDALQETMVRDTTNLRSYGVLKWVEAVTLYHLYSSILIDEIRNVGRTRRLNDYQESLMEPFLSAIKEAKQDAKDEIQQWEQFLTPGGLVGSTSRMYNTSLDWVNSGDLSLDFAEINRGMGV